MKRPKPIDSAGREEQQGRIPAAIECKRCYEQRLKCNAWRRPCSKAGKPETVYMGDPG